MASANTNKTIFTLGITAVIIFLAVKLWPAIRRAINQSGGGSSGSQGGGVGASGGYPYSPNQQSGQQNPFSANFGQGGQGSGGPFNLKTWTNLMQAGTYAGSPPSTQSWLQGLLDQTPSGYPTSIPLEPLQNLPLESYSYNDPNAPWNADTNWDTGTDVNSNDGTDLSSYIREPDYSYSDTYIDDGSGDGSGDSGFSDSGGGSFY